MSNIRYYTDGEQATATVLNRPLQDLDVQTSAMSKSEYFTLVNKRLEESNSSGMIEWGTKYTGHPSVGDGAYIESGILHFGRNPQHGGLVYPKWHTFTDWRPIANVAGHKIIIEKTSTKSIVFPSTPDFDGIIPASDIVTDEERRKYDFFITENGTEIDPQANAKYIVGDKVLYGDRMFYCINDDNATNTSLLNTNYYKEMDTPITSRQDYVFLEVWSENIEDKDFVYRFGNVQYTDSGTNGTFNGADTYSLFGNWQAPGDIVGKGSKWSTLSNDSKISWIQDPENNIYLSEGNYIQVRYRIRIIKGFGNNWESYDSIGNKNGTHLCYNYYDDELPLVIKPKCSKVSISNDLGPITTNDDYAHYINGSRQDQGDNYNIRRKLLKGVYKLGTAASNFSYDKAAYALPIFLIQKNNKGAYHPFKNPYGVGSKFLNRPWYEDYQNTKNELNVNGFRNYNGYGIVNTTEIGGFDGGKSVSYKRSAIDSSGGLVSGSGHDGGFGRLPAGEHTISFYYRYVSGGGNNGNFSLIRTHYGNAYQNSSIINNFSLTMSDNDWHKITHTFTVSESDNYNYHLWLGYNQDINIEYEYSNFTIESVLVSEMRPLTTLANCFLGYNNLNNSYRLSPSHYGPPSNIKGDYLYIEQVKDLRLDSYIGNIDYNQIANKELQKMISLDTPTSTKSKIVKKISVKNKELFTPTADKPNGKDSRIVISISSELYYELKSLMRNSHNSSGYCKLKHNNIEYTISYTNLFYNTSFVNSDISNIIFDIYNNDTIFDPISVGDEISILVRDIEDDTRWVEIAYQSVTDGVFSEQYNFETELFGDIVNLNNFNIENMRGEVNFANPANINGLTSYKPSNISYAGDLHTLIISLKYRIKNIESVYVTDNEGSWKKYSSVSAPESAIFGYILHSTTSSNTVRINIVESWSELGYASADDMLAKTLIMINYQSYGQYNLQNTNTNNIGIQGWNDQSIALFDYNPSRGGILFNSVLKAKNPNNIIYNTVIGVNNSKLLNIPFINDSTNGDGNITITGADRETYKGSHEKHILPLKNSLKLTSLIHSLNRELIMLVPFKEMRNDIAENGDDNKYLFSVGSQGAVDAVGQRVLYGIRQYNIRIYDNK